MTAPHRDWPRYLSPGWLAAYSAGLLAWLAIYELWGACVWAALMVGAAWLGALAGEAMHRYPGRWS
jgi:hypothetical protein